MRPLTYVGRRNYASRKTQITCLLAVRRAAAKRSENLKCPGDRKIKIVGLVPLNARGHPASPSASVCPYLNGLLPIVQGKCDGRNQCQLRPSDVAVSKKQCPGVGSVNFRVRCLRKGNDASQLCVPTTVSKRSTVFCGYFYAPYNEKNRGILCRRKCTNGKMAGLIER